MAKESKETLDEKIKKWTSKLGKPVRCSAYYPVWEKEQEEGIFTVKKNGKSEEIEGYIMRENKSSVTLIWELPNSADAAVDTFERDEWKKDWESDGEIEFDEHEGFDSSEGKSSEAFDENDNPIEDSDDFSSYGDSEITAFGSIFGPSDITITYENQKEVVFESNGGGSWTVKIADGELDSIPDYEAALELVRNLLK